MTIKLIADPIGRPRLVHNGHIARLSACLAPPLAYEPPVRTERMKPLVRMAIRAVADVRGTERDYPPLILAALDREIARGCPTSRVVRDLIARNGLIGSVGERPAVHVVHRPRRARRMVARRRAAFAVVIGERI